MPQIHVLYTPLRVQYQGAGIDAQAVLERLRSMVGNELASGWILIHSLPVSGSSGSWLVTLEHDHDAVYVAVRERVAWAADPEFKLWQDEASSSRAKARIAESIASEPEPEPEQEMEPELEPEQESALDPLLLPLPFDIPTVLIDTDSSHGLTAFLSIFFGIVLAIASSFLLPKINLPGSIFPPEALFIPVSAILLSLFFWGILLGLRHRKRLEAIRQLCDLNLLDSLLDGLHSHGLVGLDQALKDECVRYSPLLRRVRIILEQWILLPSLKNAQLLLDSQINSDRNDLKRGYHLMRVLAWTTAVLSLLGALIGLFLKLNSASATAGAFFSFLMILQGLVTSSILMLFSSALQSREEQLHAQIERSLAEVFLPELQRVAPEQEPQSSDLWAASIVDTTHKVMEVIEASGQKLMDGWDERHKNYLAELQSAQKTVERSSLSIVKAFEDGASAIGFQLAQTITAQKALLEKMLDEAKQSLQSQDAELKESTQSVMASLLQSSGEIGGQIKSVVGALDQAAEKHRNLTQQAFIESSRAMAEYSAETIRTASALNDLGKVTEQVLQSQATLQSAMEKLGDSKLADLLTELDTTLKDLKPVLTNLSQPFVLQAVPIKTNQP